MWLLSENRRAVLTSLISAVLGFGTITALIARSEQLRDVIRAEPDAGALFVCVVTWTLLATVHTLLTWIAYRGLDRDRFRAAVLSDPTWRKQRGRRLTGWRRL